MIRKITCLLLATVFACTNSWAKSGDYDKRLRLQTSAAITFPMGSFNYNQKENSLLGHAATTPGGDVLISIPVYHGFTIGIFANFNHYTMQRKGVLDYLQSKYASNDYYVTWPDNRLEYDLTQGGIEFARNFRFPGFELEPYVRLVGIGFQGGYSTLSIRRKLKNDNYEEQISMNCSGDSRNFFYPSLGVRANFRVFDFMYLVPGFQLMTGTMHTEMETATTDIFGGRKTEWTVLKQNVTAFQVSLGLQFRAGNRRSYPRQ